MLMIMFVINGYHLKQNDNSQHNLKLSKTYHKRQRKDSLQWKTKNGDTQELYCTGSLLQNTERFYKSNYEMVFFR